MTQAEDAMRRHFERHTTVDVPVVDDPPDVVSSAPHTLLIGDERDAYEAFRVAAAELARVQGDATAKLSVAQDAYRAALARLSREATKQG